MPKQTIELLRLAAANHDERSDGQLLEAFSQGRDRSAIETIVRRHGPMVWGVCRRTLSHHDAEDAFQATFLVLARRAASVKPPGLLGNWLYGVARRTAMKAGALAARRQRREAIVDTFPEPMATHSDIDDLRLLLDRELEQLPDKYRAPIVLCDLEGMTREDAARQLGWPEGTVHSRLSIGRKKLAARLARRGLHLSGGLLPITMIEPASGGVPNDLLGSTINIIMDQAPAASTAAILADKVIGAMTMSKIKVATMILIAGALIGTAYYQIATGDSRPSKPLMTVTMDDKPMILKGHTEAAFDVAYSPDGKRIVSTGMDKTVRVWDAETGKELHTLTGHTMPVLCVAFEPDGKHFVTAASEGWSGPNFARTAGEVKRWNLDTGKLVRDYPAPGGLPTFGVAVSPDGKRLAVTGGANGALARVTLIELLTGEEIWTHEKDLMWPYQPVDFSPDGKRIVTAGGKREVNALDAATGKLLYSTSALPDPGLAAKFHPSGEWIVAGGIGKPPGLRVFEAERGKRLPSIDTDLRWVRDFSFGRDGKLLAAAALSGVRVFDTASGKTVLEIKDLKVNAHGVAFNPAGDRLAVTTQDKLVRVFRLKTSDMPVPATPAPEPGPDNGLNARKTVHAFIDAAIAGKVAEARAYAEANSISENKVKELEKLGRKRIDVSIMFADGKGALAISDPIEIEKEGKGHLLLELRKKDGDWKVHDIDFESSEETFRKQRDFLEGHPKAKVVK